MSHTISTAKQSTTSATSRIHWRNFWQDLEFNRYGFGAIALITQSCIGSIGVMYALHLDGVLSLVTLSAVVIFNMMANSMCIALAPMKLVFWSGVASVLVSIVVILLGITLV